MNDYIDYNDWKGWSEARFMRPSAEECAYFDKELSGLALSGETVLEIGFGSGAFLAWAKSKDATVYGTEMSAAGIAMAKSAGVPLLATDLAQEASEREGRFGIVVAFDVLEHLSPDQIRSMLASVGRLLRPGGVFMARFPNGQSPLGLIHQHGDITHVTSLSRGRLEQLTAGLPLEITRYSDASSIVAGGLKKQAMNLLRRPLRRLLERLLRFLYNFQTPLGANCVVVMRRG